jgi:hypothetical protein
VADAGGKRNHKGNDRAYRQLVINVNGRDTTLVGAFHMGKKQMTLLATAGSSSEAPIVTRNRLHMGDEGHEVAWEGELPNSPMCIISTGPTSMPLMCKKSWR